MRELHGVVNFNAARFSSLKRECLLFDKFHILNPPESSFEASGWVPICSPPHWNGSHAEYLEFYELYEYLREKSVLVPVPRSRIARDFDDYAFLDYLRGSATVILKRGKPQTMTWSPDEALRKTDLLLRQYSSTFNEEAVEVIPVCQQLLPDSMDGQQSERSRHVLQCGIKALPVPSENSAWEDLLDFRGEIVDTRNEFRRFLRAMANKHMTAGEISDEIDVLVHQYTRAMQIHNIKATQSFVDVFIISPLEIVENLVKFNWSKIAKGALQVSKRKVELMEAEMKAPGRECAYVFDARKRFGE